MIDLKAYAEKINDLLVKYLPENTDEFGLITEAMDYSVMAGGKRVRAIMLIEAFRLFNNDEDLCELLALPFAAAMECIHGYSLVHDDLPSMDNDMYRRGKLTTHAKYGHAMGVLTGDALLNYSMELITGLMASVELMKREDAELIYPRIAKASAYIFRKAGFSGMIGGQVLDIDGVAEEDSKLATNQLLKLYELKTSGLFEAALCAGSILAGASDEAVYQMERYGHCLGLAFQIKDDILDITSSVEVLGKDVGNDAKNSKNTIPILSGLDQAQDMVQDYSDEAIRALDSLEIDYSFFKDLTDLMIIREK